MSTAFQNGELPVHGPTTRQMAGHLLFEVSTEVANRGMLAAMLSVIAYTTTN